MVEHVGIVVHPERREAMVYAGQAIRLLEEKGIHAFELTDNVTDTKADMILTFGGDGTLLIGARYAIEWDIPLLGFNLGTVGFLTEADPEQLEDRIERLIRGQYTLENRSLLEIVRERTGERFTALNDAVVTRGGYARLIRVESYIDDAFHDVITADGIIIATPTGSTGYSLSAGGPVVEPGMNCMVITPVCAHSFRHCPTVVSASSVIRLRMLPERVQTAELQIDGQNRGTLESGDEIRVSGRSRGIRLIRFGKYPFYHLMRTKIMEWGSTTPDAVKDGGK